MLKLKQMYEVKKFDKFLDGVKKFVNENKTVIREDISDTFQKSWNMVFNENEEDDIKQETIAKTLSSLNVDQQTELGKSISENLMTMSAFDMFKHPELVSSKIASSLQTKISNELSQEVDGGLEDMVKGMIGSSIQNPENYEKLKKQIERKIEPILIKYQTAIETLSQKMKSSILNSEF
jgi:hypothetical protein